MEIPYELLKQHYSSCESKIIEESKRNRWFPPYSSGIDIVKFFTPIEDFTWQAIRIFGKFPLYPQYPIGKYWTDFANPHHKLIIECDGKKFHQDKAKDRARDNDLRNMGWKVFRVTGADCNRIVDLYIDDLPEEEREEIYNGKLKDLYETTVDGLVRALAVEYAGFKVDEYEKALADQCLSKRLSNPF